MWKNWRSQLKHAQMLSRKYFFSPRREVSKTLLLLFIVLLFLGIKSIIVTNPLHHICFPACIVKMIFLNHLLIYYLLIFSIFVLSWWWQIVWAWDWRLKVRLSDTGVSWVGWKMQSSAVVSWQVSQWIVVLKHKEENYFGFVQKTEDQRVEGHHP